MNCSFCKQVLKTKWQKKFCSKSCAAKCNNVARTIYKVMHCSVCNKEVNLPVSDKRKTFRCRGCVVLVKPKQPKVLKPEVTTCNTCNKSFPRKYTRRYCSVNCKKQATRKHSKTCSNCNKNYKSERSNSKFCSHSCRSVFLKLHIHAHKKSGLSRSKIELFIENKLRADFSDLNIFFNDKSTIGSELDIYIPELKMAFELNGVFHYIPIYGENTLQKIQNRDLSKIKICEQRGIELITVNLGNCNFTKRYAEYVYKKIYSLINKNKNRIMWAI